MLLDCEIPIVKHRHTCASLNYLSKLTALKLLKKQGLRLMIFCDDQFDQTQGRANDTTISGFWVSSPKEFY